LKVIGYSVIIFGMKTKNSQTYSSDKGAQAGVSHASEAFCVQFSLSVSSLLNLRLLAQ
jgi:hypothetical protein